MAKSRDEEGDKLQPKRASKQKLQSPNEGEHVLCTSKVSKRKKKEHSEESQGSRKVKHKNPSSEDFHNEQVLNSDRIYQGHNSNNQSLSQQGLSDTVCEQADALHESIEEFEDSTKEIKTQEKVKMTVTRNITESPEKSISNDNKRKKAKKKRDRWGQVLSNVDNTQEDALMEDDMLETEADGHLNEDLKANSSIYEGEYDSKTVCAGGMPYETTEVDILERFEECGAIANVVCMKFADTQRFKGLAFITFKTEAAATKALSMDGVNMGGRLIKIEKARADAKVLRAPPKREPGSLSVYIGNLNWDIKKVDIKRFFRGCAIDDVRLAVDKRTGDFCGYGHVDFFDEKSLEKAIKMDQNQLLGRPVKISYALSKGSKGDVPF